MSRSLGLLLPLALACAPAAPVAPVADAGSLVIGAPGQPFQLDGATGVTFPAPGQQVTVMVRNQSCAGGAKEKIEVSCNMAVLK